jgi:AcrR family transcriptional regulator
VEPAPAADGSARRPGRPRSPRVHSAILSAAAELFAETGIEGMTMEAVAHRAKVGKAALYRRWSSKEALVTAALSSLLEETPLPDTGETRRDIASMLLGFQRQLTTTPLGRAFPRMIAEVWAGTPLGRQYAASVIAPRREHAAHLLQRGVASGQLAPDTDIPTVIDALFGSVVIRHLIAGIGEAVPPDLVEHTVDATLGPRPAGSVAQ